jgi:diguanylate cyclase (GGDEF)-like protein/PAS domain S-box-containing protein
MKPLVRQFSSRLGFNRAQLLGVLGSALILLVVELGRLYGIVLTAPFLLIFLGVVLAAVVGGLSAALVAGFMASGYLAYCTVIGFGPPTLVGSPWRAAGGISIVMFAAMLLGWLGEQNRQYRSHVNDRSTRLYRSLVEDAPEAICVVDFETGRMMDGNAHALSMFGMDREDFCRRTVADLSPTIQPDGRKSSEAARDYIGKALEKGAVTFEWWHRDAAGREFPCEVSLSLIPEEGGSLVRGSVRDITQRKREEMLREGEHQALESIAGDDELSKTLDILACALEKVLPGGIASILLLERDGRRVRHGAGPSLSANYQHAINGLEIGPAAGSCGTAMHDNRVVISEDIQTDARWDAYRPLAESEELRSCWSTPIRDSRGTVVGSFAVYYRHPHRPDAEELGISDRLRNLAGIAIERARAEQDLRHSESIYRATFENAAVGIAHLDPQGRYIQANRQLCNLLGYEEAELQQMTFEDVTAPEEVHRDKAARAELLSGKIDNYYAEKRYVRKDGSSVWANLSVGAVRDAEGHLERLVVVAEDVSAAHQLSEKLSYQARHDALTGLINRQEFEQRLAEFMEQVRLDEAEGALCYMDLDQFKLVNDTDGHMAGDEMLRQLAPRLRACIRSADTIARLGGDEFGVLLRGCSVGDAVHVAEKMRKVIEDFQFAWERHSFRLGVSIGVVPLSGHSFSISTEVLQAADTVCYMAKDEGRNRVVVWDEADMDLYRRHGEMQWVPRLNQAFEDGSLVLVAQPIVRLSEEVVEHRWFELLVRLREPEGDVPPGAFLPAAERYGLADKLDRKVVELAMEWLERRGGPPGSLRLSINLSGATVGESSFREFLTSQLAAAGPLARSLCFEITETAAITNLANATLLIEQVRAHGCAFGLDDFGSGLSSFAYLQALPVDFLKIDGAFVRDVADDPVDRAIVRSINDVAKVMGMETIAEFVESEDIVRILREIGVDYAQGFWTGRPAEMESTLSSGAPTLKSILSG